MLDRLFSRLNFAGHPPWLDAVRAGLGAVLGLSFAGLVGRLAVPGELGVEPLLIAPLGASAVLVFAIPASPLAQPRAVIGGNLLSCLIGVTAALLVHHPLLSPVFAVGTAVAAMLLLGCLHPPGGAIALAAALTGARGPGAYLESGLPVVLLSVLLTLAAVVYLNLTGRSYPHRVARRPSPHDTADPLPERRLGYTQADLDAALAQYGELLDVSRDDLDALFQQVELQVHRRIHSEIRCADVMSRDLVVVHQEQSAASALAFLQAHNLRAAPVIDPERRVVGLVRRAELQAGRDRAVAEVLDPFVRRVKPGTAIETLLPLLSTGTTHEVMVVDDDRRLVGLITQTDLLAALYRAHIVEAVVTQRAAA